MPDLRESRLIVNTKKSVKRFSRKRSPGTVAVKAVYFNLIGFVASHEIQFLRKLEFVAKLAEVTKRKSAGQGTYTTIT